MAECGGILKVVKPVKSFVFGFVTGYVGYIRSYKDNLDFLHKNLSDVCKMKQDIVKKLEEGEDRSGTITGHAAHWLNYVHRLSQHKKLKDIMYKDLETAKFAVRMMEKKDLKRSLREREMQKMMVKVMKKLKEEMENSKEETMREEAEVDYKKVAGVVSEMMMEAIEEFKKCVKKDMKMAIMVTNMLNNKDLDKLTRGDKEMEEIVWEAVNISDEELWLEHEDVENNLVKAAAQKWLTPVWNLVTPLRIWINVNDADFNNVIPEAEVVKLGLDVIDVLLIKTGGLRHEMNDNIEEHKGCCYRDRYKISIAAEKLAKLIRDDVKSNFQGDTGILSERTTDLDLIPTQVLESRNELLHGILERLKDDQVKAVGIFGMGGIGKTTLAKEIKIRARNLFGLIVMVEVRDDSSNVYLQTAIAESVPLRLHGVENEEHRAKILLNSLNKYKKDGMNILVILDNVWEKLDLVKIGIPVGDCKFLFISRNKEFFRKMGVNDINIHKVDLVSTDEARYLLKSRVVGNQVDEEEYEEVVERLLSTCGGLPLTIVTRADELRGKDLPCWKKVADYWEKPISKQDDYKYEHTNSILEKSYKLIVDENQKVFFLLACLFPLGSSVSIESVMRYGIGLKLFEQADNLTEARETANTWANELVSSSMLLEDDVKGYVKIHMIVRALAILFAAKEGKHKFLVDAIPGLKRDEALDDYNAMSFPSMYCCRRLSEGIKVRNLQILKLRGDKSSTFVESFFEGMLNLEVLDLSHMKFEPHLPKSMCELKKLRTLIMESCNLGDMSLIGELVNLLVLSLHKSYVEELPDDIEKLCKLRVLDLSMCTSNTVPLISVEVLGRLKSLENSMQVILEMNSEKKGTNDSENNSKHEILEMILEKKGTDSEIINLPEDSKQQAILEMISEKKETTDSQSDLREDSIQRILEMIAKKKGTSDSEKNSSSYLDVFEKHVSRIEELLIDDLFIQNLDKFRVTVGERQRYTNNQFCRVLNLRDIDVLDGFRRKSCLKSLLKKAEWLGINRCRNFKHLVPQLDEDGFQDLSALRVEYCDDVKCIVKGSEMNDMVSFLRLQSLYLSDLKNLKTVYDGEAPPGTFSNLQTLRLTCLDELEYVLPLALLQPNLNHIHVMNCKSLKFIFNDNGKTHDIELSLLKSLELCNLPNLLGLVGSHKISNTSTAFFFDTKIAFRSLEKFHLTYCNNVVNLWSNGIDASGFQNLKDLEIKYCDMLKSVGPPSLFSSLLHLETLSIMRCRGICEVITPEEVEETTNLERGEQMIRFPQLKSLNLSRLWNLKRFYGGGSKLEFPKLKKLQLQNSSALFHERVEIPCLEELHLFDVNDEGIALWDSPSFSVEQGSLSSNSTSMLRYRRINRTSGLGRIPSEILRNLSSLAIEGSENDVLFSSKKGFWFTSGQLEELAVERSGSLRELFDEKDYFGADDVMTLFCGHLKKLKLARLSKLNRIPMHLFKGLVSLTLYDLNWECVISADELGESLQQLQYLSIGFCRKMKVLVVGVLSVIEFRQLKTLRLLRLESLINISSTLNDGATLCLPSLEYLEINDCPKLEHFWSSLIVAPRLREVKLHKCMRHFLVGIPENMIELPSLEILDIYYCSDLQSFSHGRLLAPKLTKIQYDSQEYSMQDIGDLNVFLTEKHRSKLLLIADSPL